MGQSGFRQREYLAQLCCLVDVMAIATSPSCLKNRRLVLSGTQPEGYLEARLSPFYLMDYRGRITMGGSAQEAEYPADRRPEAGWALGLSSERR